MALIRLFHGDCAASLPGLPAETVDLAVWSPPYHVGKGYEAGMTFDAWVNLLAAAIHGSARLLKPGAFLVVNIADILCFADETLPRLQAVNERRQRAGIPREAVLAMQAERPEHNRYQLAAALGVQRADGGAPFEGQQHPRRETGNPDAGAAHGRDRPGGGRVCRVIPV